MSRYRHLQQLVDELVQPGRLEQARALRRAVDDIDHNRMPNCSASTLRQAMRLHTFVAAASVVAEGDQTATAETADQSVQQDA